MNTDDYKDGFIRPLVEYDETVAQSGKPTPTASQNSQSFERAMQCVDLLASVWPRGNSLSGDAHEPGSLPVSEGKAKRVIDMRTNLGGGI